MATVGSAIVCDRLRLYGNRSLCDRLRSTIRDRLRSAIVCDRLRSYGNQPLIKALANGFNIWFNIYSILLNAVGRLLNDVERGVGKRFQHFIQHNLASGLVINFRQQLFSRLRHARALASMFTTKFARY